MMDHPQVHSPDRLRGLVKVLVALGIVCAITNSFYFWWKRNNPSPAPSIFNPSAPTVETVGHPSLPPQLMAAIQRHEQWLLLHPTDTQAHLALAELYLEGKQFPLAISRLSMVKSAQTRNPEIPYLLAIAYMQQRQPAAALKSVQQALMLSPKHQASRELLGQIYLTEDRYTEALRAFNQCLQHYPKSAPAWLGKAKSLEQIYITQKNTDTKEFIQAATKAVQLEPANVQTLSVLARMVYTYQGQIPQAEKIARKAIDIDPNFAQPYLILVEILLRQPTPAQLDEALNFAKTGAQLDTTQPEPLYLLARVQMQKGQVDEAIQSLEQSLQIKSIPQAVYLLSQAYARAGETDKAREYGAVYKQWNDFMEKRKALLGQLQYDPQNIKIYCDLAQLYLSRGGYEPAENWLRKAQHLQKDHPRIQQLLAELKNKKKPSPTNGAAPATR